MVEGVSLHELRGRRLRPANAIVDPDELDLGPARPLRDEDFLAARNLMLFSLDLGHDRALYVQVDDPTAVRARPFLYEAQRDAARGVVAVPLALLLRWAERERPRAPILCHSTARSGSTLLVRALDRVPGVHGISEPDVFTQLAELPACRTDTRTVPLLRACADWLFGAAGRPHGRLALKLRTQALALAPALCDAWPDAPQLFLHRPLLPSVESYAQAFISRSTWWLLDGSLLRPVVKRWLRHRIATDGYGIPHHLWPPSSPGARALAELGPAYQAVAYWSIACGWVQWLRARGVDVLSLTYDELVAAPQQSVARILAHCGLDPSQAERALPEFATPSQAGSKVVKPRSKPRLSSAQIERLQAFARAAF